METTDFKNYNCEYNIIREKSAIDGLVDGNIYIVCTNDSLFATAISKARKHLFTMMDTDQLLYDYNLEFIEKPSGIIPESNLLIAIDGGVNVIIPLFTPNVVEKQYLVADIEQGLEDMYLPSMLMDAENISKFALEDALMNWATVEPDTCNDFVENSLSFDDYPMIVSYKTVAFSIAPGGSLPKVSYQQSREVFSRFVENCKLIRRANKGCKFSEKDLAKLKIAKLEVNHVFNTIWGVNKNKDSFIKLILKQNNKELEESYNTLINRDKLAEDSNLSIVVEASDDGIDKNLKNDGKFRVYVTDGVKKELVHFKRSPACIVYIMYLIDKYNRGNEVDTFKVAKNREAFCNLYTMVYTGYDVDDVFNELLPKRENKDKVGKARLRECYTDIHESIHKKVKLFGEESIPFVIPNEKSHLAIRKEKISIPDCMKSIVLNTNEK